MGEFKCPDCGLQNTTNTDSEVRVRNSNKLYEIDGEYLVYLELMCDVCDFHILIDESGTVFNVKRQDKDNYKSLYYESSQEDE
jgi:predicted RNA-binding Zn-ribbon protein involved in translation (DUF1610 family)